MSDIKVLILVDDDNEGMLGKMHKLCEVLSSQFAVHNVVVRLTGTTLLDQVAADANDDDNEPLLVVQCGPPMYGLNNRTRTEPFPRISTFFGGPSIPLGQGVRSGGHDDVGIEFAALEIARYVGLASAETRACINSFVKKHRQSRYVQDAQVHTKSPKFRDAIAKCFDTKSQVKGSFTLSSSSSAITRHTGKVRDRFEPSSDAVSENETRNNSTQTLALLTTDRVSGFDRQLAMVPFKGRVLNLTSEFWFKATQHIIPNHLVSVPHPNVCIVKKCKPFPIEFVVRSYVTGSTSTSIWKNYQNGVRKYCGHDLPEGLVKNQKLWENLLTPTTKEEEHDRPIAPTEIVQEGWMTQEDLDVCSKAALQVFALGQDIAAQHGLILVDTKYEFGRCEETGEILLIDEVHTPDSSRYWIASSYEGRFKAGLEPENIDKEFLRLWYRDHCDPYNDATIPEAPRDLVLELSRRYITLYEMITGREFDKYLSNTASSPAETGEEERIGQIIESELLGEERQEGTVNVNLNEDGSFRAVGQD